MNKFAAAINDQGRFAPTCVGDFNFVPDANAHIWKGKFATSAEELAEHVNAAVVSLEAWGDPFVKLRVLTFVEERKEEVVDENKSTLESENEALREANRQLNELVLTLQQPVTAGGPSLQLLEEANA